MKPVGLVLGLAGYTLVYFGICSLRGPGVGLLDLLVPGRTVVIPGDPLALKGGIIFGGTGPAGKGAGGSTITTDPSGNVTNIVPGPGDNQPSPGGTVT